MKKILFSTALLFLAHSLFANPLPPPRAIISEFRFDTIDKWQLEISFDSYQRSYYDSIFIKTSAGTAKIRLNFIPEWTSLLVITPDSLSIPITVDSNGDCIRLYSYLSNPHMAGQPLADSMSFGNYPGSACDSIPTGYSICRFGMSEPETFYPVFCLSRTPTMGVMNDTSGCCATMTGIMFDKNNKKVGKGNFSCDYQITFGADSTYSTRILARRCAFSSLIGITEAGYRWISIDPININAYPNSVIKTDIHSVNFVGVKERPVPSNPDLYIINFPNPFNPGTNFYIRIPNNLKRKEGRIDIYNSIGQRVFVVRLSNTSSYRWDGADMSGKAVASGVYYYRLVFDNTVYKNGSMILLK
jgi:hypothetical protein